MIRIVFIREIVMIREDKAEAEWGYNKIQEKWKTLFQSVHPKVGSFT